MFERLIAALLTLRVEQNGRRFFHKRDPLLLSFRTPFVDGYVIKLTRFLTAFTEETITKESNARALGYLRYFWERRLLRHRQGTENVAFPARLTIVAVLVRGEDASGSIPARIRVPRDTTIDGLAEVRLHALVTEGCGFCHGPGLRRVEAQFVRRVLIEGARVGNFPTLCKLRQFIEVAVPSGPSRFEQVRNGGPTPGVDRTRIFRIAP